MKSPVRTSGQMGPALKQLRKAKGWSQATLGQKLGLSQERVSTIENHPERVTLDQLLTVLMALDGELMVGSRGALTATAQRGSKAGEGW